MGNTADQEVGPTQLSECTVKNSN